MFFQPYFTPTAFRGCACIAELIKITSVLNVYLNQEIILKHITMDLPDGGFSPGKYV